jgi:hypothetical protein
MKTYVKTALAALVLCLGPFIQADGLQAEAFEDLEKLSNSLEKSLDSLQTERSRLLKEGASVAAQLAVLRAKELLSPGEHRQAEKLLQQSQSLGVQMEKLNRTIDGSKSRYESSIEQTVEACRTELSELGVELETADTARKSVLLARMRFLLDRKTGWESRLSSPNSTVAQTPNLELQPWNSRTEIRLKGDILLDEARAVRNEIATLEKRLQSLREEKEVRRNVSEISKELALFNENDELLGRNLTAASPSDTKNAGYFNNDWEVRNTGEAAGPGAEEIFLPSQRPDPVSAYGSNASGLNDQILVLEEYKRLLAARADSLEQKASWFFRKAQSPTR